MVGRRAVRLHLVMYVWQEAAMAPVCASAEVGRETVADHKIPSVIRESRVDDSGESALTLR
jgi:hypothetical protein